VPLAGRKWDPDGEPDIVAPASAESSEIRSQPSPFAKRRLSSHFAKILFLD
jgi:hypothetical protein